MSVVHLEPDQSSRITLAIEWRFCHFFVFICRGRSTKDECHKGRGGAVSNSSLFRDNDHKGTGYLTSLIINKDFRKKYSIK